MRRWDICKYVCMARELKTVKKVYTIILDFYKPPVIYN